MIYNQNGTELVAPYGINGGILNVAYNKSGNQAWTKSAH